MKKSDFNFELPEELIAQTPLEDRTGSRLLIANSETGELIHGKFTDILEYLEEGDTLVMNNTKVIPARIYGKKMDTGAGIEFLLLKDLGDNRWETLVKPGKKAKVGAEIEFGDGLLACRVEDILEDGTRIVKFEYEGIFNEMLESLGEMPLPPYITERLEDRGRYQTVYAEVEGSAAAPTAGLHFTDELLEAARSKGVNIAYVTLHVGLGTFRPVKEDDIDDHIMHSEYYEIGEETARIVNETKKRGNRVIAVGTTSVRTLESCADENNMAEAKSEETDIFIYPGYEFKLVDRIITNFHLPESTLIMLVSAKLGSENTLKAYREAVDQRYRFFSFGDAMFII
ncbi:S-adenosylmethionine:tRNA ribosyltransferase-isomerase [Andreesenia angusta]|uniref:S-adenosylmethionine:tRNA ribosyltransferase-isomerase n=1 Tax=Andreesenia angusta TaxID=39480 RepID=A0A1S1V8Y7_9FIRM|nr:tRNA preQ1(34) S-adenosylmethionine ribosyltransferase-isomerase QueA [Andreesenia angusta]OHW62597.1 S-adenosylmethionine:tRNA ribosyltransferase-isomerase [Andreesenia angusta]